MIDELNKKLNTIPYSELLEIKDRKSKKRGVIDKLYFKLKDILEN